jgi:hypothetical protein
MKLRASVKDVPHIVGALENFLAQAMDAAANGAAEAAKVEKKDKVDPDRWGASYMNSTANAFNEAIDQSERQLDDYFQV